jgi:hypothetical protein
VERVTGSKPDERLVERLTSLVPYGVGELVELRALQSRADVGSARG